MSITNHITQPTDKIALALGSLGSTADRGCPPKGQCKGCTPFCCADGEESQSYVKKVSAGEVGYDAAIAAVALIVTCVMPVAGVMFTAALAIEQYVLKPFVDWINFGMNKKTQKAYAIKQSEQRVKSALNYITAMLQCHYPWCEMVSHYSTNPNYASNSPSWGADGPNIGKTLRELYIISANKLNNTRFGKTKQTISNTFSFTDRVKNTTMQPGLTVITVPNIESYWMGEKIIIPGVNIADITILHRYGKSANTTTWDCDRVFLGDWIYPTGAYGDGRGCKLGYGNASLQGRAQSFGGAKDGYNVRNMSGKGDLILNIPWKAEYKNLIGKQVDLANPVYINEQGQVFIPPAQSTLPLSPGTIDPITGKLKPLSPNKATLTSSAMQILLFMGVAAGFLYKSFR